MTSEKIKEVMEVINRLSEMDAYSKGVMAGYILSAKEKKIRKEKEIDENISKN